MAKLSILNRDVAGFAQRIGNVAWLVKEHWEGANPRGEGDDYSGRIAQLATLEDNAVVLLPLQHAPLIETNREGALSYRDQLLASGAAQPRSVTLYDLRGQKQTTEPEKFMPAKSIERVLSDVEIARLAGAVEMLTSVGASIQTINAATTEHVGYENAVALPKLATLVERHDGVPPRRPCETRSVPRAAARGADRGGDRCRSRERSARRRRPHSRRAPKSTRRLLPHSAISPPPSRQVRRCFSSGRRARCWARTSTR